MMIIKVLAGIALLAAALTAGCGFAIRYGGEAFKGAATGHMILGIICVASVLAVLVSVLIGK